MKGFVYCVTILCLTVCTCASSAQRTGIPAKKEENDMLVTGIISFSEYSDTTTTSAECKCENGKCKEINGKTICVCNPEHGLYDDGVCKACECGYEGSCTFDLSLPSDGKKCVCQFGLDESTGKCIDPCQPNPCKNGGKCRDGKCSCPSTHYGEFCETCRCYKGFCEEDADGKTFCKCRPEWSNVTLTFCLECDCGKESNCTFGESDGFSQNKHCICKEGYKDNNGFCKGTCQPNPCRNGGGCVVKGNAIKCKCESNFDGELCEKETCSPNPCKNKGTCDAIDGKIYCTCLGNYDGDRCERNLCLPDPCNFRGECKSQNSTFVCSCSSPYGGETCEKNLCHPNPCLNNGKCSVTDGIITCSCVHPFIGDRCERECQCKNGFCEENTDGETVCKCPAEWGLSGPTECIKCDCGKESNCTFDESYMSWIFPKKTCVCKEGYKDNNGLCKDICDPNPCLNDGNCTAINGSVSCSCEDGFSGNICETELCSPNPCLNDGECMVTNNQIYCVCKHTFSGEKCETDLCSPNPCLNNGTCTVTNSTVTCSCEDTFVGDKCETDLCAPNTCMNGGNCTVKNGRVDCVCEDTFVGDKCETEATLPVSLSTSAENSTTTNEETREIYTTVWTELPNTRTTVDDTTVEPDITRVTRLKFSTPVSTSTEEPSKNHSLDMTGETGSTTVYSTTVQTYSTDRDSCAVNPCQNEGICKTDGNGTKCYCIAPFSGELCEKDPCSSNACMKGGLCKIDGKSFLCECISPYYGTLCEKDPCTANPCQNGGTCFISGNGFECECKTPFAGAMCEIDPCFWNPCKNGGICKIVKGDLKCFCTDHFSGDFCESRIDACVANPCKNGGICKMENNAMKCFCKEPFIGEFCESRLDACVANPCKNGGICKMENNAVKCFCKEPFSGEFCDYRSGTDGNIIIFAVVSVLLVIVLIFVSCITFKDFKF